MRPFLFQLPIVIFSGYLSLSARHLFNRLRACALLSLCLNSLLERLFFIVVTLPRKFNALECIPLRRLGVFSHVFLSPLCDAIGHICIGGRQFCDLIFHFRRFTILASICRDICYRDDRLSRLICCWAAHHSCHLGVVSN